MKWRIVTAAVVAVALGSLTARAQFQTGGSGVGAPGGSGAVLQFNTSGIFGGITGVTADNAGNVGFATSSSLFLYGIVSGNCLKVGASNQIADSGTTCGGTGSPGGVNTQVQFNTNGAFGGISGATSNGSNISFTTNNLVINGQAISKVSGTTGTLATVTGALSTNCIKADGSGNLVDSGSACGGTSATNIAAGSNITTSGSTANVTVAVIANPSFNTVTISGNLTGGTAQFTGAVTGTTAVFQTITDALLGGCLNATAGVIGSTGVACATQTSTPSIAAGTNITTSGTAANTTINVVATPSFTTVIASGNITAGTAQFTGAVTGTTAQFQTLTVTNLTPTGPNCLQETGGVLQATNSACAAGTLTSIAQGNNIVTSGTASNITVTATPTGASNTVQFNNAGVFGGDAGFQYAGGSSGIVTHTLGTVTTTNSKALSLVGNWSNSTTTFAAPLFVNVTTNTSSANTTSGFGVGSRLVDIQATSLSVLSISPSGAMSSAALQSGATQCLQASSGGLVFGTAVPCATQTSTPSIAAGSNITTSGTAANTTVNMVPTTPEFGLQYNHAGLLTADTGFTYGSSPGIATLTLGPGNLTTTNSRALSIIGTLSSGTVQFGAPLFMNITTNAFASGTKLVDVQASGISFFSIFASTGMTVLGNITGTQAQITGWLTGPGANFQSATIGGALIGSTGNFSSNLTASTVLGVVGWLTAPGVNMQTATLAGALIGTSGNFSTNLTGNIAQFAGFLSAGGASLSGLTIATETLSSNLTGTTANFSSNLTANIAQFPGFLSAGGGSLSGLSIQTATFTGNLTGTTANFSSFTGGAAFSATPTVGAASLSFISPSVAQFGLSNTIGNGGWINWGGESRLAADKGLNISNAGLTATGLSVNVLAGRTYSIDADLYVTFAVAATGGIAVSLSGTYGSTDTHYFGYVLDAGAATGANGTFENIRGATLATAKNTLVGNVVTSGTTAYVPIKGTVSVSAPGTLLIAAATVNTQTAANGVTLTRGSRIIVHDMP